MYMTKGHQITLIPSPEGSMWACQYVIRTHGETEVKKPSLRHWPERSGSLMNRLPSRLEVRED